MENIKRAIITPTYSGHFKFISIYLKSLKKFLEDKDFPLYFVISKSDESGFKKIIRAYTDILNINVLFIDDLFEHYKIPYTPDEFLKKFGSISFQTMKKFYAGLFIGADQFLFLDSESMLVKPTNMNTLFDNFFKKPRFWVSRLNERCARYIYSPGYKGTALHCKLLDMKPTLYAIESFEWFYDKKIFNNLFKEYGSPFEIITNMQKLTDGKTEQVLEAFIYYQYLIKNHDKYGYEMPVVQDEFKKFLGEKGYEHYMKRFESSYWWFCGIFEEFMANIDKHTEEGFRKLIDFHKLSILRSDGKAVNISSQMKQIKSPTVHILAASQNHCLGLNFSWWKLGIDFFGIQKELSGIGRHFEKVVKPFYRVIKWFGEIASLFYYLIKMFFKCLFWFTRKEK